jgi:hypothetical protein
MISVGLFSLGKGLSRMVNTMQKPVYVVSGTNFQYDGNGNLVIVTEYQNCPYCGDVMIRIMNNCLRCGCSLGTGSVNGLYVSCCCKSLDSDKRWSLY